jgi:hypothetical protein
MLLFSQVNKLNSEVSVTFLTITFNQRFRNVCNKLYNAEVNRKEITEVPCILLIIRSCSLCTVQENMPWHRHIK